MRRNIHLTYSRTDEFEKSRKVLAARRKSLVHEHAKGNKPQAAQAIDEDEDEEDVLFEAREFGDSNPVALQTIVWWHNRRSNEEVLYMKAPLGKNEIGKFLSTAAKNAGLHRERKKVTNHSVTKTCISTLLDADVPENFVAQLSGHKSTES